MQFFRRSMLQVMVSGALCSALPSIAFAQTQKLAPEYDVIVIGSGFAGLAAAISAAENGAKVVVLEKMQVAGGNSSRSGGMMAIPGSSVQKEQGIEDSPAKLAADMKRGIIPSTFLPLQSGVGNIANAVLGALGRDKTIPAFEMYTEVIQNSVIGLIREGRVKFGSACSLTVTNDCLNGIYEDMDFFRDKLVLRPSEISNSPEVVRRLGIISINTAIEADLYGNVNSTHIGGTKMMNGIGGSGDFTRNAYISIFTCPSVAKEGKISAIVPMVSHVDHSEHDVNIIVTEQGVADLRGKSPKERAQAIIENCVHPDYKNILWDYLKLTDGKAQTPHSMRAALAMHAELAKSGDMKNVDWAQYK